MKLIVAFGLCENPLLRNIGLLTGKYEIGEAKMQQYYIDIGGGWFASEDTEERKLVIYDSAARDALTLFGPAAWGGRVGPISGKPIMTFTAVNKGSWQQTGRDSWHWITLEGLELSEPLNSWPRELNILDSTLLPGVQSSTPLIFEHQDLAIDFIQKNRVPIAKQVLVIATYAERFEMSVAIHRERSVPYS